MSNAIQDFGPYRSTRYFKEYIILDKNNLNTNNDIKFINKRVCRWLQ